MVGEVEHVNSLGPQPGFRDKKLKRIETQGTADARILSKAQGTGGTHRVWQHLWREWMDQVLSQDLSLDSSYQ